MSGGFESWSFAVATISAIVAILAFFRPEIESIAAKWKNKIEYFPYKRLEIGFSDLGPTIGIHGTILARGNEQLIQKVSIEIQRKRDNAKHAFEWNVFRKLDFVDITRSELEPSSPFVVGKNQAEPKNILLYDETTQSEIKEKFLGYRSNFLNFCNEQKIEIQQFKDIEKWHRAHDLFGEKFQQHQLDVYEAIAGANYWTPGVYDILVKIKTSAPEKDFDFHYSYFLSDAESRLLKLNSVILMQAAIYYPNPMYNFANPELTVKD